MDCKFERTEERAIANASSPLYKGTMICGEDLTISFHKKKTLFMRQSWAVGFSILEISKCIMYDHYYNNIQPIFGVGNVAVLMSDTDSFLLKIKGCKVDDVVSQLAPVMDFSNYDPNHPFFDDKRAKMPGLLKNEMPKCKILEVVALKPKTYALRTDKNDVKTTCKGVVGSVREKIPFEAFRECIRELKAHEVTQYTINSKNHINRLLQSRRIAFTSLDDKRHQTCAIHSTPYGSAFIQKDNTCFFCQTLAIY